MFSVAWMTDSDQKTAGETLQDQFKAAKAGTAPVGGNPGSTVMSYGKVSLLTAAVAEFEGGGKAEGGGGGGGGGGDSEANGTAFGGGSGAGAGAGADGSTTPLAPFRRRGSAGFSVAAFLQEGRVSDSTPWVVAQRREGGLLQAHARGANFN
jgi:hypothetical protein